MNSGSCSIQLESPNYLKDYNLSNKSCKLLTKCHTSACVGGRVDGVDEVCIPTRTGGEETPRSRLQARAG